MKASFNSHEFIEKYRDRYKNEYAQWLDRYGGWSDSERIVHRQIGRFLAAHADALHIRKAGREPSKNCHGHHSPVTKWERL